MSLINGIRQYIKYSSEEELTAFFTFIQSLEPDIKNDLSEYIKIYNVSLSEKYKDNYVEYYFKLRGLLIEEKSTDELVLALKTVITGNQKAWDEYKKGNDKAIGRFIGLLVKEHKLDPKTAKDIIESNRKIL